jgi:hypothetical protein
MKERKSAIQVSIRSATPIATARVSVKATVLAPSRRAIAKFTAMGRCAESARVVEAGAQKQRRSAWRCVPARTAAWDVNAVPCRTASLTARALSRHRCAGTGYTKERKSAIQALIHSATPTAHVPANARATARAQDQVPYAATMCVKEQSNVTARTTRRARASVKETVRAQVKPFQQFQNGAWWFWCCPYSSASNSSSAGVLPWSAGN